MVRILIINGPNLNLLGTREQAVYGAQSFESYLPQLENECSNNAVIQYFQSNTEGLIIDKLHEAIKGAGEGAGEGVGEGADVVILNAGGYTHTSVAIADAVSAIKQAGTPTIEVHISNILAREEFRHKSLIAPVCIGTITGFGLESYSLALVAALKYYSKYCSEK